MDARHVTTSSRYSPFMRGLAALLIVAGCARDRVVMVPRECTAQHVLPPASEPDVELDRLQAENAVGEARKAFHAGDYEGAAELAKDAIPTTTGHARELATYLYADSLFHLGEYQRAKTVFVTLRSKSGRYAVAVQAKIRACNKALALDEDQDTRAYRCPAFEHLPSGGCATSLAE